MGDETKPPIPPPPRPAEEILSLSSTQFQSRTASLQQFFEPQPEAKVETAPPGGGLTFHTLARALDHGPANVVQSLEVTGGKVVGSELLRRGGQVSEEGLVDGVSDTHQHHNSTCVLELPPFFYSRASAVGWEGEAVCDHNDQVLRIAPVSVTGAEALGSGDPQSLRGVGGLTNVRQVEDRLGDVLSVVVAVESKRQEHLLRKDHRSDLGGVGTDGEGPDQVGEELELQLPVVIGTVGRVGVPDGARRVNDEAQIDLGLAPRL